MLMADSFDVLVNRDVHPYRPTGNRWLTGNARQPDAVAKSAIRLRRVNSKSKMPPIIVQDPIG
jgi:hypothetical protein